MPARRTPKPADTRRRILIVDDHAVLREGWVTQLNREADRVVCGEVTRAREAVAAVEQLEPGLVLADITLIGKAKETKEISRRLGVSAKTVEAQCASIKRKLRLKTRPELTRHAVLWVEAVS